MTYPGIRIQGAILSPDILVQIEELPGQRPSDFGLDSSNRVKDEIARSWADAQDYWRIFQRKLDTTDDKATTLTRNQWIIPLMGLLRYDIAYQARGTMLDGRLYNISHYATNRANTPVQIIGARDPAGLDKKPDQSTRKMSAHALIQEFLNLHDQLYGLVTNGRLLRLLRDSSRLVRQSYLEFDLDRIFGDGLYADFALLYRLLHATRLPISNEMAAESLIERYHQDSLDQGARIREGLSRAVKEAVLMFGNGFLKHPTNTSLRERAMSLRREVASEEDEFSSTYFQQILRLIYRLLFLMVIEERELVFPKNTPKWKRDIYYNYYSVTRLRLLSETRYLHSDRHHNLWLALQACFQLFEADGSGDQLGMTPLAGDLFSPEALKDLNRCTLGNDVLQNCLRTLSLYRHPDSGQLIRVNYAALNVEEFGSVYEGLLEFESEFVEAGYDIGFQFKKGKERSATGSHYTPDDLVQPLVKHSLDHLIEACLKKDDPAAALLELKVADIACGSGHILLAAARRIGTQLAIVQTGEEQPSPSAYREALRNVISRCIYGVDVNPLAVELCKVALWLEAHNPGKPLNFLDHHIKCGNAIVGFAHLNEVGQGIPMAAFKTLSGDDKSIAAAYRKRNKEDIKQQGQLSIDSATSLLSVPLEDILNKWKVLLTLPEQTPAQVEIKKQQFDRFRKSASAKLLRTMADIPIAQFYTPKTFDHEKYLMTDSEFRGYCNGRLGGDGIDHARQIRQDKRFFHWFLEFPDVMDQGGFDCILGNPPYLGGQGLSGTYGHPFCEYIKWQYAPAGLSDLVVFFLRRIYVLLKDSGFASIITTNSIIDGKIRRDGLEQVIRSGGEINMAIRGVKWPGVANLVVSTLAIHKGKWTGIKMLDNQPAERINTFFEDDEEQVKPSIVAESLNKMFQGAIYLGDGFLLTETEADQLHSSDPRNGEVIMPIINGKELNSRPDQAPGRSIINFRDWPIDRAREFPEPFSIVEEKVKPFRATKNRKRNREVWWIYAEHRPGLTQAIQDLSFCFAATITTKYLNFSVMPTNLVFSVALYVFATDRWDLFSIVQSTLHEVWARKYSGTLTQVLRYSSSNCFNTFAFPKGLWETPNPSLADIGEKYHTHRKDLMQVLWLGLTDIYNLFHNPDLSPEIVAKISKKDLQTAATGYESILELRRLHIKLDSAVRDTYGWQDLDLEHDFHDMETLPQNDRIRYTISSKARREVLKRLLAENHTRASRQSTNAGVKRRNHTKESTDKLPNLYT